MNTSPKKVIWLMLLCVVILSAGLTLWQWRYATSVLQGTAEIRRQMRAQGFKTDLEDFNFTNDVATEMRLMALNYVWSVPEWNTNQNELELLPVVTNDLAEVVWQQGSLKFWQRKYYWDPFSRTLSSNSLAWSDLQGLLTTNRFILDVASAAILAGPLRFDVNASNGVAAFAAAQWIPFSLTRVFDQCIVLDLHDGNREGAWTNFLAVTRLITASPPEPTIDCWHSRSATVAAVFAVTWQALQQRNWPEERLARLQQEWESVNLFTNIVETTVLEHAMDAEACQDAASGLCSLPFSFPELLTLSLSRLSDGYDYLSSEISQQRYRHMGRFQDEAGLLRSMQKRAIELRQAVQAKTWTEMRSLPGVTNAVPFKSSFPLVVTAITAYHQLDNALLAMVAVDFMDGQPLRYRRTEDGHFVLYSVGFDCVDDGGKMAPLGDSDWIQNFKLTSTLPENVDIVWPRPNVSQTETNRP